MQTHGQGASRGYQVWCVTICSPHDGTHALCEQINGWRSRECATFDVKEIRAPVEKVGPPTLRPRRRQFLTRLCRIPHCEKLTVFLARPSLIPRWGRAGHHPEHVPGAGRHASGVNAMACRAVAENLRFTVRKPAGVRTRQKDKCNPATFVQQQPNHAEEHGSVTVMEEKCTGIPRPNECVAGKPAMATSSAAPRTLVPIGGSGMSVSFTWGIRLCVGCCCCSRLAHETHQRN